MPDFNLIMYITSAFAIAHPFAQIVSHRKYSLWIFSFFPSFSERTSAAGKRERTLLAMETEMGTVTVHTDCRRCSAVAYIRCSSLF